MGRSRREGFAPKSIQNEGDHPHPLADPCTLAARDGCSGRDMDGSAAAGWPRTACADGCGARGGKGGETMSGICGYGGEAVPGVLEAMLAAIDYGGDRTDLATAPGVGLGYRWWGGRPGKSAGIHRDGLHLVACAGTFAPPVPSP